MAMLSRVFFFIHLLNLTWSSKDGHISSFDIKEDRNTRFVVLDTRTIPVGSNMITRLEKSKADVLAFVYFDHVDDQLIAYLYKELSQNEYNTYDEPHGGLLASKSRLDENPNGYHIYQAYTHIGRNVGREILLRVANANIYSKIEESLKKEAEAMINQRKHNVDPDYILFHTFRPQKQHSEIPMMSTPEYLKKVIMHTEQHLENSPLLMIADIQFPSPAESLISGYAKFSPSRPLLFAISTVVFITISAIIIIFLTLPKIYR